MRITQLDVAGAALVQAVPITDERGSFARTFCRTELAEAGLNPHVEQVNSSFNERAGTLRGMHYQVAPAEESKLVRCTRGAVLDVLVDMREGSPTYLQHHAVELHEGDGLSLFVPEGCAHGYYTLLDRTEVFYQVSAPYTPGAERGLRHDDPALGIRWPGPVQHISDKDRAWPLLAGSPQHGG